jgi:two-component system, chemotaxis family, chemotaxis protein CheY
MKHILVVDDDESFREFVRIALRTQDYAVDTAADGAEALDKVRQDPPSLLLLDLMMPVMDGWQFVDACRKEPGCEQVPIVIMSAGQRANAAGALQAQAFLAKPFGPSDLFQVVERVKRQTAQ